MKIENAVALVTGANRGIGAAFVPALLERGAAKVYAAARDLDLLTPVVALDRKRVVPVKLDVTKPEDARAVAAQAGDLTFLINNAGISHFGVTLRDPAGPDTLRREFEVNVFGLYNTFNAFADILGRNGGGAIANILSAAALMSVPLLPTYACSKAAALSLSQGMRQSLAAQKTLVSICIVGSVDTRLAADVPGHVHKETPRFIADAVLDGVQRNEEDIDTDPMAVDVRARIARDPKKAERWFGRGLALLDQIKKQKG